MGWHGHGVSLALSPHDHANTQSLLSSPDRVPPNAPQEMEGKYKVDYIAGGATQNSIRVAQWMLQVPGATTYMGSVGDDHYAEELKKTATKDGVNVGLGTG
jgi:adenosine kinase